MASRSRLAIITYDVSDDRARERVSELLMTRMTRVQGSVFEGWMTAKAAHKLAGEVASLIDSEDSLRCYVLTAGSVAECAAWGFPPAPQAGDFLIF